MLLFLHIPERSNRDILIIGDILGSWFMGHLIRRHFDNRIALPDSLLGESLVSHNLIDLLPLDDPIGLWICVPFAAAAHKLLGLFIPGPTHGSPILNGRSIQLLRVFPNLLLLLPLHPLFRSHRLEIDCLDCFHCLGVVEVGAIQRLLFLLLLVLLSGLLAEGVVDVRAFYWHLEASTLRDEFVHYPLY